MALLQLRDEYRCEAKGKLQYLFAEIQVRRREHIIMDAGIHLERCRFTSGTASFAVKQRVALGLARSRWRAELALRFSSVRLHTQQE